MKAPTQMAFTVINSRTRLKPASKMRMIAAFFLDNPEEELTYEQVQIKFSVPRSTAKAALRDLYAEGLLESVRVIRLKTRTSV